MSPLLAEKQKHLTSKDSKGSLLQKMYALLGLILLSGVLSVMSPHFPSFQNILSISLQTAIIAILALGQTYVIISAGIDLSVGSVLALSGVISRQLLVEGVPVLPALIIGIVSGGILGLINGLAITKGNLPPFIVTLGMMGVARGIALVLTNGLPVSGLPDAFTRLGNDRLFYIPIPVLFLIVVAVVGHFVLRRTVFGRYVYAIGSNEEAARLSGIPTALHKTMIYTLCGMFAGLAGVLLSARLISAQPTAGTGYELDAIAAVVIGGASLMGGVGSIGGTVIGAFIMGVLRNGLNLLSVSPFWQQIAIGLVIVLAVYLDQLRRKKD
ncbi:ABC transporter permease [Kroppenstedtia eburnea]|uniref:ABC transporter permease n=1 Tax=Kroppenstedtia eburnea TaxID=714067 RepID=UPI00362C3766